MESSSPPRSTFELHVIFSGLCLYAKDESSGELHVLLVDPSRMTHHESAGSHPHDTTRKMETMPKHFASLFYDKKYLKEGTAAKGNHKEPLEGRLTLGQNSEGGAGEEAGPPIPPHVFDLWAQTNTRLDRKWLSPTADGLVTSVVTLAAGEVRQFRCSGPFDYPMKPGGPKVKQYLTWQAGFSLNLSGNSMTIKPSPSASVELEPRDGLIELRVKSVIEAEDVFEDPRYAGRASMNHVGAYHELLASSGTAASPGPLSTEALHDKHAAALTSDYFTCFQAAGRV